MVTEEGLNKEHSNDTQNDTEEGCESDCRWGFPFSLVLPSSSFVVFVTYVIQNFKVGLFTVYGVDGPKVTGFVC